MTPKLKAEELIEKYHGITFPDEYCGMTVYESIQCAIIAVEEIIKALPHEEQEHNSIVYNYWDEVLILLKSMK